jgi:hypothetical protein
MKNLEINGSVTISKNCSYSWYKQYRIKDEETIIRANEIWKKIIEKDNDK